MPLVQISVPAGKSAEFIKSVSGGVHDAMVATIDIPSADRFQAICEHPSGWLVCDPTYLGVERSAEAIIVRITMRSGRTNEKKRALYKAIAQNLHDRAGVRKQDVMVVLFENEAIDWSFGEGEAQYSKG